ncbi:alpha/beta fold hydrolase [Kushneria phosphatilytica]|uniref:Alpha/beta fold hydrolase n=1 Tax=Kushneria phosphatilytica TaxID=657387 RepID=A0A1S1NT55_9GAMM|nr:alpha/beta fold hydrolase [Kushneria phosphatilytica]OHV07525.1 hypothetical protein BH688_14955 [Kushneria phosphatilytica]QEL10008.1 alpha/beta fold hydrolase [Kushneria phosphatilytica]
MAEPERNHEKLILLPGWALGPDPLMPLARAIKQHAPGLTVECARYPALTSRRREVWLEALDAELPDHTWLAGWSLGGMLATALADRRGARARGLITLGSNVSFITRPGWSAAMARHTFEDFRARLAASPGEAFERFAALSARGSHDARHLGRELLNALRRTPSDEAAAGLALLQQLDLRDVPARLKVPQLHLFGEHDVLVPEAARVLLAERLPPTGETRLLAETGHGFPIERVEETAGLMAEFIGRHAVPRRSRSTPT